MKDWIEISIKELGRVVTGKTPPTSDNSYFGGNEKFVSPKDMDFDSRYIRSTLTTITTKALEKFKNQVLPVNSIMFTCLSYGFGKIGITDANSLTNQQINSIIVDAEKHNFNFVYYLLRYNKERIFSYNSGIVTPIIPKSVFEKIKVYVPKNKNKEIKIASILSAYDDLIENNLKRIKLLEESAEIVYKSMFGFYKPSNENDQQILPKNWQAKRADELFRINIGKTPPREQDEWFNDIESGVKWVSIKDINQSKIFIFETGETVTESAIDKFNMNVVKSNTVILSFKLTVGKVAITTEDMVTNEAIAHFNIDDESKMNTEFIYFYLKNFPYDSLGSTSSIGTAINSKIVKAMPILFPTSNIIQEFGVKVKNQFLQINNLLKQNAKLREARDILLPRLMSGEIEV